MAATSAGWLLSRWRAMRCDPPGCYSKRSNSEEPLQLDEADELADQIAVLGHGKVVATGSPEELKRSIRAARQPETEHR
jgi:hypothetical protein